MSFGRTSYIAQHLRKSFIHQAGRHDCPYHLQTCGLTKSFAELYIIFYHPCSHLPMLYGTTLGKAMGTSKDVLWKNEGLYISHNQNQVCWTMSRIAGYVTSTQRICDIYRCMRPHIVVSSCYGRLINSFLTSDSPPTLIWDNIALYTGSVMMSA